MALSSVLQHPIQSFLPVKEGGLFPAADWNQKPMVLKNLPCAILLISPLHGARAALSDPLHPSFPAGRPVPGGCSSSIIADMRSMQGCRMTAAACLPLVMIRRVSAGISLLTVVFLYWGLSMATGMSLSLR